MERKIDIEKVYDNYKKGWNGRMKQGELPEIQKKVTYPHPSKTGEMTSQNYIEYDDLAVVAFVRKNKNGQFEFGLTEQEAPAFIYDENDEKTTKGYNGVLLEAPTFAFPEKDKLPENLEVWIEENILDIGLEIEGFATLDNSKTAVTQSFTNQNARFYVAGIKGKEQDRDNKMHWFPISSLESYLDMQRNGGKDGIHSSIQTLYPLELLRNKYINQIRQMTHTEFKLDRELPKLKLLDKKVTNPSYRFNIVEASYLDSNGKIKQATYLTSHSNAGNCILMTENNENLFLSPQQRSPFLESGEEIKTEAAGGLTEGRPYEIAALAELSEEQGFKAESIAEFTGPLAATPLTSELSKAYIAYYENGTEQKQHLDEQEKIGKKQAISFKELKNNIQDSKIPLTTKYYIMLKARDLEKENKKDIVEER